MTLIIFIIFIIKNNKKIKNLRKFVRACESDEEATYKVFREWLAGSTSTEQEWETVIEEDEDHDYSIPNASGNATTPSIGPEVGINTSSSMGSSCENEDVQESDEEG